MKKYCRMCGAEMEEGAKFCPQCGATVIAPPQNTAVHPTQNTNVPPVQSPIIPDSKESYEEPAAETTVLDQNAYANRNVGFAPNYNGAPQSVPAQGFNRPDLNVNAGNGKNNQTQNSKTKKIIAVVLAVAVLVSGVGVGIYIHSLKKDLKDSREDYLNALAEVTEKKMVAFYYDDYNGDGESEAFAVVGSEEDSEEKFSEADIWFVNNDTKKEVAENISGHTNGILQSGDIKYVSIEKESDGKDESVSLVYGVNNVGAYEPEISGRYSGIHQDGDRIVGEDRESGDELIITLNDDGSFSVDEAKEPATSAVTEKSTSAVTETTTKSTTAANSGNKETEVYKRLLKNIISNPGSYYNVMEGMQVSDNEFSLADIDNDGVKELMVRFTATFTAGMYTQIWKYNSKSNEAEKLFILGEDAYFYNNGIIKVNASHNHSNGETVWPYGLGKNDGGVYKSLYSVYSIDRDYCPDTYRFPSEHDKDGDGVIYVYTKEGTYEEVYIDKAEYDKFVNENVPESKLIKTEYKSLTSANVDAIK